LKKAYPGVCREYHEPITELYAMGESYADISRAIAESFEVQISPASISTYIKKHIAAGTPEDESDPLEKLQPLTGVVSPETWRRENGFDESFTVDPDVEEETGVTAEEESSILSDLGYDPDKFYIAGAKHWQRSPGGEHLNSYNIQPIKKVEPISTEKFDALIASITDVSYPEYVKPGTGDKGFVFAVGDLQLGKSDGDGTAGTVKRYMQSVQNAVDKVHRFQDEIGPIHLSFVGDLIEGMVSQGGRQARRTELTTTQQVQLLQELFIYTIKAFAPLTDVLTIDSVPGNHDQAQREPVSTDPSDSWAVQALASIQLSLKEFGDPYLFGHVSFGIVPYDEDTLTRFVAGTKIVQVHGDQWNKGKHWDWLKGQVFNRNSPMVGVHVLIHGHNHTGMVEQENDMFTIRTPSFESESNYYRRRAGSTGNPSAVTFLTKDGDVFSIDFK
jgi:predicted phosphodiesterase